MRGRTQTAGGSRSAFAALLALVLLSRLLIPAGYMVGPTDSGQPGLVLCGAAAAPHSGHQPGHHSPSKPAERPCPFAALAAPVLPPSPIALPPTIVLALPTAAPIVSPVSPPPAAPLPPARGPPLPA
jgi:hypothetical protein